jgi:26S proteasome regulatory subunit N3
MVDVDMKPAAAAADITTTSTAPKKDPITPKELVLVLLRHNLQLIVRSVIHLEPRFAARAVRTVSSTRKLCHLHPDVLARVVEEGTEKGEYGPAAEANK